MRPKVYVAGPITSSGNLTENVRHGVLTMRRLWDAGFTPFCPHLSETVNLIMPMSWDAWLTYDEEWIRVCDAVLRLPGVSKGADREEIFANVNGIPVFTSLEKLLEWKDKEFSKQQSTT